MYKTINNCLAKWRLGCLRHPGASTIGSQLTDGDRRPWLANPGNPAMSPHAEGESRHPSHWKKKNSGKEREGQGRGDSLQGIPMLRKTLTLRKRWLKCQQCPMDQAHEESWHMRVSNKPLTVKVKLVLLVVHLTAYRFLSFASVCTLIMHRGPQRTSVTLLSCSMHWQIESIC